MFISSVARTASTMLHEADSERWRSSLGWPALRIPVAQIAPMRETLETSHFRMQCRRSWVDTQSWDPHPDPRRLSPFDVQSLSRHEPASDIDCGSVFVLHPNTPMTNDELAKVIRVLTTEDHVFGLVVDSLLRQAGNEMTAALLLRALQGFDVTAADFQEQLAQFVSEYAQGDPSILIGLDDGRWEELPEEDADNALDAMDGADGDTSRAVHFFRLVYTSVDASYFLFHAGGKLLDGKGVLGGARKREGAVHHLRIEVTHPRYLQLVLNRARECPHMLRIEESTEAEFWAAESHNPGY
jgi:hypothetical protein